MVDQIDLYRVLPEEWFEQIGDFSTNKDDYAPIDYDLVTTTLYEGNSFFGGEILDLLVDHESQTYYLRSMTMQPIGDYAWTSVWGWWKSDQERYSEINQIITHQLEMKQEEQQC